MKCQIYVYLIFLLMMSVFQTSCVKKIEPSIGTAYIGTWKLKNITCSSTRLTPTRWQELLTLNESTGKMTDMGPECFWSVNSFSVKPTSDFVQFEGGATACSPASCSLTGWFDNGAGTQTGTTLTCADGVSQPLSTEYRIDDSSGYLTSTSQNCTINYERVAGTAPNASCINHNSAAINSTQTGGFTIQSDDLDKAGFRFAVTSSDKQLWGLKLKMTSSYLTSATIKIYEGGTQPENGALVATSILTDHLDQGMSDHYFYFAEPATLKVGTNYYMTLQGKGSPTTGTFNIAFNASNLISQSQSWAYTTSWSLFGTQAPNMGFIFGTVGCQ